MRKSYLKNKAGVSLITVLMFMLVATIAATATWKFITSEGFSSSSRMLKREAYQSAQAGIENARTWMTFHANEVGSLIKQFQDNNGTPINLDNQLLSSLKAGQSYHVWLTGVNTENTTYKLKIVSEGESRNDTRHTEVAIFNVDGLYRVQLPVSQSSYSFAEAFHGDLSSIDKLDIDKAVITQTPAVKNAGGQALNDLTVTDYLILDGHFYANNTNSIKDLYVTGSVGSCSGINVSGNLFVGDTFYTGNVLSKIEGSLYAGKAINLRDTYRYTAVTGGCASQTVGSATITGNITIGEATSDEGAFIYYDANGSNTFTAKSSMVLNGKMVFPTNYPGTHVQDKIRIEHNVYVKKDSEGSMGEPTNKVTCGYQVVDGRDAIPRTKFGSGSSDKIWLKGFTAYQDGATPASFSICNDPATTSCQVDGFTCARTIGYNKWIGIKGEYLSTEPSTADMSGWNANKMEQYKSKLEERNTTCNTAKTPIQINTKIFDLAIKHSKTKPHECSATIWSEWDNTSTLMNECYQKAKEKGYLYNNSWLILEFDTPVGWQKGYMGTELVGNFIFKFNASSGSAHQVNLPATSANSKVLLYLPNGWPGVNDNLEFVSKTGVYRYFVYAEGNVKRFDMAGLETPMSGSVVMANCASFNTDGNNTLKARFDQELTDDLADASIICDNDGSGNCSGTATSASSTSSDDDIYDRYYISMAPQLGVSLESQSKSYENVGESNNLDSSFIILPRVISLPNDPYGTLGDYINVKALNSHKALTKADLSLSGSCTKVNGYTSLDISSLNSKLFSPEGSKLPKGNYKCEIAANGYEGTVPIWLAIDSKELRDLHQVSFNVASQEIHATETKDVYVRLQPNIPDIDLSVKCPAPPGNWEYTYVLNEVTTGGTCTFRVSNSQNIEKLVKLFSVKTTGASSGTMTFQLLEGDNYILTAPSATTISMSTTVSLTRDPVTFEQLSEYCTQHADICPTEDERNNWPTCQTDLDEKWVEPDIIGFQTVTTNDSWLISATENTSVKFVDVSKKDSCIVVIPNETCTYEDGQKNCTLHASINERVNKIKFKFKNVDKDTDPYFSVTRGNDLKECKYSSANSEHECIVNVYGGGPVTATIDPSISENKDFKYWKCSGPSCPDTNKLNSYTYRPFRLSDNETVITVMFNEVDKHCFFDKFQASAAACKDLQTDETKEYCIDYCDPADHCTSASATTGNYKDAKWHLVSGSIDKVSYSNGILSVARDGDITLMSTINADAGTHGSLKALVRLSKNDTNSGFLLGSNADATNFLKLNVFIDNSNNATVRVCNSSSETCREETLNLTVTEEDMVMIEAEISANDITIGLFKGNESTKASVKFDLGLWSGYYEGSHVGLRIANHNFKLYGIGWKSQNYECFNTYPTIKCSFAAVAYYGVIPTASYIKPWVGYSGWEGWNTDDCVEKYYYQGEDACQKTTSTYTTCEDDGYFFDSTSSGKHGFIDNNGNDIRTAKVGLDCQNSIYAANTEESMWANDSAHCGVFWTGAQNICSTTEKINMETTISAGATKTAAFSRAINMRSGQIQVITETSNTNLRIWLYSEGEGETLYQSEYVTMIDTSIMTFNISDFETDIGGFDISKVKSILIENRGNSGVKIMSVASLCESSIKVNNCKAEDKVKSATTFGWFTWGTTYSYVQLTANINNRDGVDTFMVVAKRNTEPEKTYKIGKSDILVYGTETAIITLPRGMNDINGWLNQWNFSLSVKADGANFTEAQACRTISGLTPSCNIEKPGPENELDVPQSEVEFKAKLEQCKGCSYIVELDGEQLKSGNCTKVTGPTNKCNVNIPKPEMQSLTEGRTYTFKFYSPDGDFDACERTFTVTSSGTTPEPTNIHLTECTATLSGDTAVTLVTAATGCPEKENCTYSITNAITEVSTSYKDNQTINFSYAGEGTVSHTLTITKGTKTASCTFNVAYNTNNNNQEEEENNNNQETNNDEFDCTADNSIEFARETEAETEAGQCVKYTMPYAAILRIGCWWAPSLPVNIKLRNCDGSFTTVTQNCLQGDAGWVSASTGQCTVYLKPEKKIKWKFSDWN